jgi:hypothetical protein
LKLNEGALAPALDLLSATRPKTTLLAANKEKKICLFQPLPTPTNPSRPFYSRILQAFQALKAKCSPNQAYPKCNCTSSSSITQQKIPHTSPFKNPTLGTDPPPTYAQNSSTSTLTQIA